MTIDHRLGSKVDAADIPIVAARVIEGEWFHCLRIENTDKGQLDSLFLVIRDLRPLHCRLAVVNSALQRIAPGPALLGNAARLLLGKFPQVRVRPKLGACDLGISNPEPQRSGVQGMGSEPNYG